jgi:hypothetical protein
MTGGAREGAGRPKGSTNKATAEVRALASQYGENAIKAIAELAGLVMSEDGKTGFIGGSSGSAGPPAPTRWIESPDPR